MKKKDYKELVEEMDVSLAQMINQNERTEKHLQIAEREIQAKERLIVELKIWIQDLVRGGE